MTGAFLLILSSLFWSGVASDFNVVYEPQQELISISGISAEEWSEIEVSVFFGEALNEDLPAIIGKLNYQDQKLTFKPKYGFSAGSKYTVVISQIGSSKPEYKALIEVPAKEKVSTTFVKNVFPSSATLPMNQLKLYLEFSAAMRMGRAYDHIKLYRLPENVLEEEAFLAMPEELWDPERKRLTIFFDPGRIKRGVQPNLQLGLPLLEGRSYKLVIDSAWLDANGAALTQGFEKEFTVATVDRKSPEPKAWELLSPDSGSLEALVLDFGESLDYGLLNSALVVLDVADKPVRGTVKLSKEESIWHFVPAKPWLHGVYKIVINPWLEDLAGNNLRRKFDIDLHNPADAPKDIEEVTIPFQITQNN